MVTDRTGRDSDGWLSIADIETGDRLRPLAEDAVVSLMEAIGEVGFVTRILVRRHSGRAVLLDGGHRLEAMRRLGRTKIPAVIVECTDKEARFLEADSNLAGADLTPLDLSVFLSARRKIYQEMYPETRQGHAGAAGRWMHTHARSLASTVAEARGVSVRQIEKIMAAGDNLEGQEVTRLRTASSSLSLKDLLAIGKIAEPEKRADVISALAEGQAKSASQALSQLTAKPGRDPTDAAYEALSKAFARAPMAARRRFVAEHGDALAHMIAEARD